jgi:hypothetical protein
VPIQTPQNNTGFSRWGPLAGLHPWSALRKMPWVEAIFGRLNAKTGSMPDVISLPLDKNLVQPLSFDGQTDPAKVSRQDVSRFPKLAALAFAALTAFQLPCPFSTALH